MPDIHVRQHKELLWLIFDRQPLNPLTAEMLDQLTAAIRKALQQPPRLIVLTGMGEQAFCAGVDLPDDTEAGRAKLLLAAKATDDAFEELRSQHIPSVALVKGSAFGAGCELASLCEFVIAREDAYFRLPAINAKVFTSAISLYLPHLIGQEETNRLVRSGETLSAREAMRLGLAHQVLPMHRFLPDTEELLIMLASIRTW